MKQFYLSVTLFIISTAISTAGTFEKIDEGSVSWNIKNNHGKILLSRFSQGTQTINLSTQEEKIIRHNLTDFSSLGTLLESEVKFDNGDERSQNEIASLIRKKMSDELSTLKVYTKVISQELNFTNLLCAKKGLFNKSFECSAHYKSKILVEISIESEVNRNLEINNRAREVAPKDKPELSPKNDEIKTLAK